MAFTASGVSSREKTATTPSAEAAANKVGFCGHMAIAFIEPECTPSTVAASKKPDSERRQIRRVLSTEPDRMISSLAGWEGRKRTTLTLSEWPLRVAVTPCRAGSWMRQLYAWAREDVNVSSYVWIPKGDAPSGGESYGAMRRPVGSCGMAVSADSE